MDGWIQVVIFAAIVLIQLIAGVTKRNRERTEERGAGQPAPAPDDWPWPDEDEEDTGDLFADAGDDGWDDDLLAGLEDEATSAGPDRALEQQRQSLVDRLDALIAEARELSTAARLDPATRALAAVLDEHVVPQATSLRRQQSSGSIDLESLASAESEEAGLQRQLAAIENFVMQRRRPGLREALGDADALALACYQPLIELSRSRGLPLTSTTPVTVLGRFDRQLWQQFIPTSVAPLFLPADFFKTLARWPALARETGRDFLAASGAGGPLRRQLGIADAERGSWPLSFDSQGLSVYELQRIFGAWFDELFVDVFGTLMLGPGYGYALARNLAAPADPQRIARVGVDATGRRYELRPPDHLRLVVSTQVLDLAGESEAAAEIREAWQAQHAGVETFQVPVAGMLIQIPLEPLESIAADIATRLYREPVAAFGERPLSALDGLAWDTRMSSDARRARDELSTGRLPRAPARAVVAGALMGWWRDADRDAALLQATREAIIGVTERRPDAYAQPEAGVAAAAGPGSAAAGRDDLREAFILHTLLAPPPARARAGRGGGLLSPRRWPPPPVR